MCKKFVSGLTLGLGLGALAALLYAPKSGKEMREDLMDKSEDLKAIALDYMELLTVKGEELLSATKDKTENLVDKLNETKDSIAQKAVEMKDTVVEEVSKLKAAE